MSKDRFNFIKLKINKIAEQKIGKNNAIKEYNDLVNKAEQISNLRPTSHRQEMWEIFNNLEKILMDQKKVKV